jgi:hypothetical protein
MLVKEYPYIVNVLKLEFWMKLRIFYGQPHLRIRKMSVITILTDTFYCCLVLDTEIDNHNLLI